MPRLRHPSTSGSGTPSPPFSSTPLTLRPPDSNTEVTSLRTEVNTLRTHQRQLEANQKLLSANYEALKKEVHARVAEQNKQWREVRGLRREMEGLKKMVGRGQGRDGGAVREGVEDNDENEEEVGDEDMWMGMAEADEELVSSQLMASMDTAAKGVTETATDAEAEMAETETVAKVMTPKERTKRAKDERKKKPVSEPKQPSASPELGTSHTPSRCPPLTSSPQRPPPRPPPPRNPPPNLPYHSSK